MARIIRTVRPWLAALPLVLVAVPAMAVPGPGRIPAPPAPKPAADRTLFLDMLLARQEADIRRRLEARRERLDVIRQRIEAATPAGGAPPGRLGLLGAEVNRQLNVVQAQLLAPPPTPLQLALARQSTALAQSLRRIDQQLARLSLRRPTTALELRQIQQAEARLAVQKRTIADTITTNERFQASPSAPSSPTNVLGLP